MLRTTLLKSPVLYQDAADKLISKAPVSSANLKTSQVCSKEILSWEELKAVYKLTIRSLLTPSFKTIEKVVGLDGDKNNSASRIS